MNITDIAFSAYTVIDVKRARAFYEGVLGLKPTSVFEEGSMTFIEYEVGSSTLVIGAGAPHSNSGPTGATVTLEVADFDAAIADLRKANVKFIMEPQDTGVCHMALIADPDGNYLMIHRKK